MLKVGFETWQIMSVNLSICMYNVRTVNIIYYNMYMIRNKVIEICVTFCSASMKIA